MRLRQRGFGNWLRAAHRTPTPRMRFSKFWSGGLYWANRQEPDNLIATSSRGLISKNKATIFAGDKTPAYFRKPRFAAIDSLRPAGAGISGWDAFPGFYFPTYGRRPIPSPQHTKIVRRGPRVHGVAIP